MQSFQLIKPCLALAPYIRHYWILQDDSVTPVSERTLPIGCMQLVFHKGKQLLLSGESELQPQSFISGQSVGFSDVQSTTFCFISLCTSMKANAVPKNCVAIGSPCRVIKYIEND